MLPGMRSLLGLLIFLIFFLSWSCREPRTATSCPGGKQSPQIFNHHKKTKSEDGFKQKDRKSKRSAKKAEKGKKKEKRETKVEKRWHLFRKNREAKADVTTKTKSNSAKNERKQKRLNRKRKRHPQMGLFPNGNPG
jgi:hypothetical protein